MALESPLWIQHLGKKKNFYHPHQMTQHFDVTLIFNKLSHFYLFESKLEGAVNITCPFCLVLQTLKE